MLCDHVHSENDISCYLAVRPSIFDIGHIANIRGIYGWQSPAPTSDCV